MVCSAVVRPAERAPRKSDMPISNDASNPSRIGMAGEVFQRTVGSVHLLGLAGAGPHGDRDRLGDGRRPAAPSPGGRA